MSGNPEGNQPELKGLVRGRSSFSFLSTTLGRKKQQQMADKGGSVKQTSKPWNLTFKRQKKREQIKQVESQASMTNSNVSRPLRRNLSTRDKAGSVGRLANALQSTLNRSKKKKQRKSINMDDINKAEDDGPESMMVINVEDDDEVFKQNFLDSMRKTTMGDLPHLRGTATQVGNQRFKTVSFAKVEKQQKDISSFDIFGQLAEKEDSFEVAPGNDAFDDIENRIMELNLFDDARSAEHKSSFSTRQVRLESQKTKERGTASHRPTQSSVLDEL